MNIGEYLNGNPYPGRGVFIGITKDGTIATAYFIMGRSTNSRNRVFVKEADDLMIRAYDESLLEDSSLIIYYPIRVTGDALIVTNGDQTDTIRDFLKNGSTFEEALETRKFEPDGPNWTPRISGIAGLSSEGGYKLSILKSMDAEGTACCRYYYEYERLPGFGNLIHTYVTDGSPIPSFEGEPVKLQVPDSIDELTNDIWENLDSDNKISLYVRYTNGATGEYEDRLINKLEQ